LYIDAEVNDVTLLKALRSMDRIEVLGVGIRDRQNLRRKLLKEMSLMPGTPNTSSSSKTKSKTKDPICPKLKTFRLFPGIIGMFNSGANTSTERAQLETQAQELRSARPEVDMTLFDDFEDGFYGDSVYMKMTKDFIRDYI
jgi:hypothetical protein